jgi:uncharacterized membrane protein
MGETRARSVAKTVSWRVVASLTTAVIVLLLTGQFKIALTVVGVEAVAKFIVYYLHERAWSALRWGSQAE